MIFKGTKLISFRMKHLLQIPTSKVNLFGTFSKMGSKIVKNHKISKCCKNRAS